MEVRMDDGWKEGWMTDDIDNAWIMIMNGWDEQ